MLCGQACEKIYRASYGTVCQETTVNLEKNTHFDWLPQPAILFDGGRLKRSFTVEMDKNASLLGVEATILGRTAMQENVTTGFLDDHWSISRDGELVFYDQTHMEDNFEDLLASPSGLCGNCAFGSVLMVSEKAEEMLGTVRESASLCQGTLAASYFNGLLFIRFLAENGQYLIMDITRVLSILRGGDVPRFWNI